jgi:deoxyribonuclease V
LFHPPRGYHAIVIACVDVHYEADRVTAACVGGEWTSDFVMLEVVVRTPGAAAPYRPGAFYERELPYLIAVLDRMPAVEAILVDAYVWLGPEHPGLGWHLHQARQVPVIGVAKTAYAGAESIEVLRGTSARPLYVTAIGIDAAVAADHVRAMHGEHRIPTLVGRADALARGR